MKFNWGTGVFIFLILFLLACAAFIIFAFQQDVNLVHKDYYEQGVDYSEQMKVNARSTAYANSFKVSNQDENLLITISESLASKMDSGTILLYRPSDSKRDVLLSLEPHSTQAVFSKSDLIHGRYILKFYWYSGGLKYEVNRPVNIQ